MAAIKHVIYTNGQQVVLTMNQSFDKDFNPFAVKYGNREITGKTVHDVLEKLFAVKYVDENCLVFDYDGFYSS